MKSSKIFLLFLVLMLFAAVGCGKRGGGDSAPATLVSISVTPVNASISLGTAQQFTVIGNYSNNTQANLTEPVTWNSSNTSVATIDLNGKAVSQATGTSLITAVTPSFSASTVVKVTSGGTATGTNVMPITVNGSFCSANSYLNKPCVSVTICDASNCRTIDDIVLDTGSFGLRIFQDVLQNVGIFPIQVMAGSGTLAECVTYGDGSSEWGPVQTVGVKLASEPTATMPIQVIDQTFGTPPQACSGPYKETSSTNAGFNGVLGVGVFTHDCGFACATNPGIGMYYSCSGSACAPSMAPLSNQVQNPVSLLPLDNNGVIVELPSVSATGVPSVDGSLVLGIGTRSNNMPSAVTVYPADGTTGDFVTSFNGVNYTSFIDTGSNGIFFPATLPSCSGGNSAWLCPPNLTSLIATNQGTSGTPSADVSFAIGNFNTLLNSSNRVFNDVGGNVPGMFDWGLPLHLGRDVYVGFSGTRSSLGTGPYWAY